MGENKMLNAEEKIHFYIIALRLFDNGKSHPQIVEILSEYTHTDIANVIADKAFREVWDKLHEKAAKRLAKGKLWNEVVEELSVGEPYKDVVEWLVNDIYLRNSEVSYAEDKFHKRFEIWGYLLIMGIIQLVRYLISPYNKAFFLICMGIGIVGLCWGIWDVFISKKNDIVFRKFAEYERFKSMIEKKSRIELLFTEKEIESYYPV